MGWLLTMGRFMSKLQLVEANNIKDILEVETDNQKDAEKKRKILDWTHLYNSIKTNIQDASQKLSAIFVQIENQQNSLDSLNQNLLKVSEELFEIEIKKKQTLNEIQREREVFEETKSALVLRQEKAELELKEKEKNLERKELETDDKVRVSKDKLIEIKKQIENKRAELPSLGNKLVKANSELVKANSELVFLKENIEEFKQYQENALREKNSLIKQREKIEADIYEKQRSLDSFKENKNKMEKDLLRKMKDLQILEGRLRNSFKKIGEDFSL